MNRRFSGQFHRIGALACACVLAAVMTGCDNVQTDSLAYISEAEISVGGQVSLFPDFDFSSVEADFGAANEEIVSVDKGIVTGLKEGETVVTAVIGRKLRTVNVTVNENLLGVKSTYADANLCVGDRFALTADGTVWTSSDESVLSVQGGVAEAVGVGKATVGYRHSGKDRAYTVVVMNPETAAPPAELPDDGDESGDPVPPPSPPAERVLLWSDEFDGDALNEEDWEYQTGVQDAYINTNGTAYGPWFWGNDELQYYTKDAVSLAEGVCTITAARRSGLPNGRKFTSARITTRDRGYWTYGYFEARMKLPEGTGMWPAFWMLPQPEEGKGTNNRYGGWAANGEIDIMEAKGRLPYEVATTLHFGGNPSTFSTHTQKLGEPISEWHTYGFEWRSDHMAWYIDGVESYRMASSNWFTSSAAGKGNETAPFDVPFYLLINLAVGGRYDGSREPAADFVSAAMQIDYVRVYA